MYLCLSSETGSYDRFTSLVCTLLENNTRVTYPYMCHVTVIIS